MPGPKVWFRLIWQTTFGLLYTGIYLAECKPQDIEGEA